MGYNSGFKGLTYVSASVGLLRKMVTSVHGYEPDSTLMPLNNIHCYQIHSLPITSCLASMFNPYPANVENMVSS